VDIAARHVTVVLPAEILVEPQPDEQGEAGAA
jgi:hypothetical protein